MKYYFPLLLLGVFSLLNLTMNAQSSPNQAKFNHLAIYVTDLKRAGDFYKNIIGLDTIPEPFHDGKHIWLKTGPGNALHIIEGAEKTKEYFKNNHICFSISSMDDFTNMLKAKNIVFEDATGSKNNKVNVRPDGVKQIWLQDPDGYWIEINDAKQ